MKKYIKRFFKEIIPVIAGILIALWINNWNEDRKDRAYVDKMYSSIKKELRETSKEIDKKMKQQQKLVDTLSVYINDNELTLLEVGAKADGIHIPTIRTNAWKTLSNSKIELLDYKKVSLLSNVQEGKEVLKMKIKYSMDFVYNNTKEKSSKKKELLKLFIEEIMSTEKGLKKEIEKVINETE